MRGQHPGQPGPPQSPLIASTLKGKTRPVASRGRASLFVRGPDGLLAEVTVDVGLGRESSPSSRVATSLDRVTFVLNSSDMLAAFECALAAVR